MATGISITPDSLEICHCLVSNKNDKLIIKFSRKMLKWFCQKKKLSTSILVVLVLKVVKSLSMRVFAATTRPYGVNEKRYGQRNGLKLSGLAIAKSK